MSSPPLTPIRQFIPSIEPLSQRRPSSSYSNARSPTTPRSNYSAHRLSNSSHYSNGTNDLATPIDGPGHETGVGGGGGGGNLADELEFADDDEDDEDVEWDDDGLDEGVSGLSLTDEMDKTRDHSMKHELDRYDRELLRSIQTDGARDSGVDVAFGTSPSPQRQSSMSPQQKVHRTLNFSRPISRDSESEPPSEVFSLELEDAMKAIARLASPPSQSPSDTITKALSAMQHLAPQTTLETHTQRLTTSTNSLSSHLTQQTRLIASLSSSLFPPIGLGASLDVATIDEIVPQMTEVLQHLPLPDPRALQGLTKLDRETADLLRTLSSLTDSLQVGKQTTTIASRHLRSTHTMVTQLRRESELAEQAKWKIEKEGWGRKLADRWCARECTDVIGGFERVCEGLRRGLEESITA